MTELGPSLLAAYRASVLVPGLNRDAATRPAREFGQHALV